MSDPMTVIYGGVSFAIVGGFILLQMMLFDAIRSFRRKLKSEVSRYRAVKLFPEYWKRHFDWLMFAKVFPILLSVLFTLGMVATTFAIGFDHIFF